MKKKVLQKPRLSDASVKKKPPEQTRKRAKKGLKPDPTRYGDWVKNGRCIDF